MSRRFMMVGAIAALVGGCGGEDLAAPTEMSVALFAVGGQGDFNLGTHLHGGEEVLTVAAGAPHPSDSRAQGQAIFRVSDDGSMVAFKLIASNIENINQAHIHCGRFGENGPIRMWLHPNVGPTGTAVINLTRQDGVLAEGSFSPTGIICPAANVGTDTPLLDAMRAGLAYVNVHTTDGVNPGNTGPGDFPGGEIRGQLGDKNR